MQGQHRSHRTGWVCLIGGAILALCSGPGIVLAEDGESGGSLTVSASRDPGSRDLRVRGAGSARLGVIVVNAFDADQTIGETRVNQNGRWRVIAERPRPFPCRVRAIQSDGLVAETDVRRAPANCAPKAPEQPPANTAPTAQDDDYGVDQDATLNVAAPGVLGNDSDADGDALTAALQSGAAHGAVALNADGGFTYAPNAGFSGTDAFTYVANDGAASSNVATVSITVQAVQPPPVSCDPIPSDPRLAHSECISAYTGPEVCVACHEAEARDMHGSVHYQQGGAFPNTTNIPADFAAAGERPAQAAGDLVATGINTYCGTHENSPRFTCAGCHVGNGRFPMAQSEFERLAPDSVEAHRQLANIDCLMCHQQVYKRFPDPAGGFEDLTLENVLELDGTLVESPGDSVVRTGLAGIPIVDPVTLDFQFIPADPTNPGLAEIPAALMGITALEAAQSVHRTTRQSCLNCHAGAAGGNGAKRGDLSTALIDPPVTLDMHMSSAGGNLTCSNCHSAVGDNGESHRFRGRGLDLRPNDATTRFSCETGGCHSNRPHGDFSNTQGSSRDKHAMKIACQTCHIPTYAKVVSGVGIATEVSRDWQDPHVSQAACNGRGGWLPREDKGENLVPSYAWFDGTSEIYYLGERLHDPLNGNVPTVPLDAAVASRFGQGFDAGDPAYVLGMPNGNVTSTAAKLYPMKEHWGKLARHVASDTLIGHSTFEFFRTGDFNAAVRSGMAQTAGMSEGDAFEVVPVHTYQTINHGVETSNRALGTGTAGCGACHAALSGGPLRMDLKGELGYGLRRSASAVSGSRVSGALNGDLSRICAQCHGNETSGRSFSSVHSRHVQDKRKDCAACHEFSRPERGLSLSR